jgi:thioredoxin 1
MPTTEITKENIETIIGENDMVMIDCWATWCAPCRSFAPIYEAASDRHTNVIWGKIDTENQPELAAAFGIKSIPTVMVFRQGILLFQQAGVIPAAAIDELVGKVLELNMDDVRKQVEEHEKAHAEGRCDHDH